MRSISASSADGSTRSSGPALGWTRRPSTSRLGRVAASTACHSDAGSFALASCPIVIGSRSKCDASSSATAAWSAGIAAAHAARCSSTVGLATSATSAVRSSPGQGSRLSRKTSPSSWVSSRPIAVRASALSSPTSSAASRYSATGERTQSRCHRRTSSVSPSPGGGRLAAGRHTGYTPSSEATARATTRLLAEFGPVRQTTTRLRSTARTQWTIASAARRWDGATSASASAPIGTCRMLRRSSMWSSPFKRLTTRSSARSSACTAPPGTDRA